MRFLCPELLLAMAVRTDHLCRWLQVARVCIAGSKVTIGLTGGAREMEEVWRARAVVGTIMLQLTLSEAQLIIGPSIRFPGSGGWAKTEA